MPAQTNESWNTIAYNWIREATEQITSADAFYELLRYTPNYVPRRIARDIWREYGTQEAWRYTYETMDPNEPLLRRFFADIQVETKDAYNVKIRGYQEDPFTGELKERYQVIGFSHAPSMNEIEAEFQAGSKYLELFNPEYEFTFNVEFLFHNQTYPW